MVPLIQVIDEVLATVVLFIHLSLLYFIYLFAAELLSVCEALLVYSFSLRLRS